jgi:hypothetical protein
MTAPHDVLVIGAGLAGATAARALVDAGRRVIVLDKGRGPGGRLSTRRVDGGTFDHGAAVLQASDGAFRQWLESQAASGVAAPWGGGWVGVPGMNALVATALEGVTVRWQIAVAGLRRSEGRWEVRDADGATLAEATRLIVAIPAPQAAALLRSAHESCLASLIQALDGVRYAPCWAGLFVVDDDGPPAASTSTGDTGIDRPVGVSGLYRQADKPGRTAPGHWVMHATEAWSESHLELDPAEAAARMLPAFLEATGLEAARVRTASAHRWRYARPTFGADTDAVDGVATLGVWLAGDAIGDLDDGVAPAERAWRTGRDAASRLLAVAQPKS